MKKKKLHPRRLFNPSSSGQALVIIAVAFVALLAFVGFTVDVGQLYVYMGHLRRSVDAGSLAAAAQYREGRDLAQMAASAQQVMKLNGVDPSAVIVQTCETNPSDPALCVIPRRKYVRVIGEVDVPMAFLHLIGMNHIRISANAISEAASMDVVLVIDISESMAGDASLCDGDDDDGDRVADDGRPDGMCGLPGVPAVGMWDNRMSDPSQCNPGDQCHPFEEVKTAAKSFVERVLDLPPAEEADRLAIVTFSNGWEAPSASTGSRVVPPGWMVNGTDASNAIDNLKIYQPPTCDTVVGPCLAYDTGDPSGNYIGFGCPLYYQTGDPSSCTSTNIGGGMLLGGNMFAVQTREDALWVVVLLTDGAANASNSDPGSGATYGYCPSATWTAPFCRDKDTTTRHATGSSRYDADDYGRDMADFVGCYPLNTAASCSQTGQGAVIFTIGLGDQVLSTYGTDPIPPGVSLLRYIGAAGDDGDPGTDPCSGLYDNETEFKTWCGNYYFSPTGDKLTSVFEDIASRMFTRITH